MGRMGELADAVSELRKCGEILIGVSETLTELFSSAEKEQPKTKDGPKTEAKQKEPEKALALEDVRAVLAEKSRDGYTADVKALLLKHGADRLSGIDPAEYPALVKEAEVLGNG